MNLLENVFLADGTFSQDEAGAMTQILGSKGSGNRSNESYLESNEEAYDAFSFQMGLAYYYYYGDGGKQMSKTWFDTAAANASGALEESQVARAERLGRIAGYWASLNKTDKAGDSTASYYQYWQDMTGLIDGNLVEMDNERTALVMYQEVVYQISQNTLDFKTEGVTQAEMEDQLDKIESRLETDIVAYGRDEAEIDQMKAQIQDEIQDARRQVEIAFSSLASGGTGTGGDE